MCMNFRRWPDFPWRLWLFTPALGRVLSAVRRCGHSPPGKFQMTDMTDMTASQYSCPSLVVPNTEELISRPFLGENRFWWVLQNRMSTENAMGCLFFSHAHFCFVFQKFAVLKWAFEEDLFKTAKIKLNPLTIIKLYMLKIVTRPR